jgi:hypothetical protein
MSPPPPASARKPRPAPADAQEAPPDPDPVAWVDALSPERKADIAKMAELDRLEGPDYLYPTK